MKNRISVCIYLGVLAAGMNALPLAADEDIYEGCTKSFSDSGYGSAHFRQNCAQVLAERRAELDAWGIDNKKMSDVQAWNRYEAEFKTREEAKREQRQRDYMESQRLAADRAAAEAEQARIDAERSKQAEAYGAEQRKAGQAMMKEQNEMLKGLGVNLGGVSIDDDEDLEDEEYSATELKMYQRMVDDGAAPGCKGLKGAALVDCVDEALDEEE